MFALEHIATMGRWVRSRASGGQVDRGGPADLDAAALHWMIPGEQARSASWVSRRPRRRLKPFAGPADRDKSERPKGTEATKRGTLQSSWSSSKPICGTRGVRIILVKVPAAPG